MRVAVVDMGTNSTRLLVGTSRTAGSPSSSAGRRSPGWAAAWTPRGSSRPRPSTTSATPSATTWRSTRSSRPERVVAIATSAVRDASNGSAFLAELRERFELDARMLDGDEEARLTYLGACAGGPDGTDRTLVIDIGGGSTELIVGSGTEIGIANLASGGHRPSLGAPSPRRSARRRRARDARRRRPRADRRGARGRGDRQGPRRDRGRRHPDLAGRDRPGARPLRPRRRQGHRLGLRDDPADVLASSRPCRSPSASR